MTLLQGRGRAPRPPEFMLVRGRKTLALVAAMLGAQGCGGGSVTITVDVTTAVDGGGGSDTPAVDGGGGGMDGGGNDSGGGGNDSGGGGNDSGGSTEDAGGSTDGAWRSSDARLASLVSMRRCASSRRSS